jgi:hypothetical protein
LVGSHGGIALQAFARADQKNANIVAPRSQQPCRDEAITAIVSWTGHNNDPCTRRMPLSNAVGNRPTGILHQSDSRNAARDADAIGVGHLFGGEKLNHYHTLAAIWIYRQPEFTRHRLA